MTAAARKINIDRRTLHRKINEMNAAKAEAEKTGEFYAGPLTYNRQGQQRGAALPSTSLVRKGSRITPGASGGGLVFRVPAAMRDN